MAANHLAPTDSVLVGIVNTPADIDRLLEQQWYRIPMTSLPRRRWPPKWFAAFEPKSVAGTGQLVRYHARVRSIDTEVPRSQLFPGMPEGPKAGRTYAVLRLDSIQVRSQPITAVRPRRNPFIPTTWSKFMRAAHVNDLFDASPHEDRLWDRLKRLGIEDSVEREWELTARRRRYYLDFAIFCERDNIDVEVDGDAFHLSEDAVKYDKARNRELEENGWRVLRYSPQELRETMNDCLDQITATISTSGGLAGMGTTPSVPSASPMRPQGRLL